MIYIVSISSNGRITVPLEIRKKLGLDKPTKVLIWEEKGKIFIEPKNS
ncbi:MAG: AbrB/MazE/SpoVT family DNA-binding domain-containing protein [bacterium]|nr:AbrB/MazE/SpoVT family DNA-binding domain-containing protein [bacterium]